MKNEFDKPTQGISHKAGYSAQFLYVAIKYSKYAKGFSDASLIRILPINSLNTVRVMRKKYLKEGLIMPLKLKKNYLNNEKFYRIKKMKKAEEICDYFFHIVFRKDDEKRWGKFDYRFGRRIPHELNIEYKTKPTRKFNALKKISKTDYIRKICPVCSKKMKEFMNSKNYGPLDRKCLHCKFKFRYMDGILLAIKD